MQLRSLNSSSQPVTIQITILTAMVVYKHAYYVPISAGGGRCDGIYA